MPLVLASSSRYRHAQLQTLGIPFICAAPAIDESPGAHESASQLAARLAVEKARALSDRFPDSQIIGCDQTVAFGERILGKPGSIDAAVAQLQQLRGKTVIFHSAIALLNTVDGSVQQQVIDTTVRYRLLSDAQIHAYLERDRPFDCAGSFKSESLGIAILDSVNSDDPTALVGLPLIALTRMLANTGIDVLASSGNNAP